MKMCSIKSKLQIAKTTTSWLLQSNNYKPNMASGWSRWNLARQNSWQFLQ